MHIDRKPHKLTIFDVAIIVVVVFFTIWMAAYTFVFIVSREDSNYKNNTTDHHDMMKDSGYEYCPYCGEELKEK